MGLEVLSLAMDLRPNWPYCLWIFASPMSSISYRAFVPKPIDFRGRCLEHTRAGALGNAEHEQLQASSPQLIEKRAPRHDFNPIDGTMAAPRGKTSMRRRKEHSSESARSPEMFVTGVLSRLDFDGYTTIENKIRSKPEVDPSIGEWFLAQCSQSTTQFEEDKMLKKLAILGVSLR